MAQPASEVPQASTGGSRTPENVIENVFPEPVAKGKEKRKFNSLVDDESDDYSDIMSDYDDIGTHPGQGVGFPSPDNPEAFSSSSTGQVTLKPVPLPIRRPFGIIVPPFT